MIDFINKHFRKSKTIKIIYFGEGKKHVVRYLIPKDNVISFSGKAFLLNQNDFFVDNKNFITYVFSYNRVEPIDPNDALTLGNNTPANLAVALESDVATQILSATKNKTDINLILFLIIGITVLGLLAVWYTLSNQIKDLTELLQPLSELIRP